jgi:endonuclease/exonuclease/phosphatase (EEP) superfamily protein YafD
LVLLTIALAGQGGRFAPVLDLLNSLALWLAAGGVFCALVGAFTGQKAALLAGFAAMLLSAERVLPEWTRAVPEASSSTTRDVSLLIFNVHAGQPDPLGAAERILAAGADVVLLQEAVGILSSPAAADRLRSRYPFGSPCPRRNCDAVIYSRWPVTEPSYRFRNLSGEPTGTPLATATIVPGGARLPFPVASVHLPRGWGGSGEVAARAELAETLLRHGTGSLVIGGDFNTSPFMFAMNALDEAVVPFVRVTRATPTYPAGWRVLGLALPAGLAIDHLFVGPAWAARSVRRLPAAGSDHYGLVITLQPLGAGGE